MEFCRTNNEERLSMSSSLKKNLAYNMLYQIVGMLIPLIISPYLARVLGVEKIGIYSWTYSKVYYFSLFAMLGINNYGSRTIAFVRDSTEKTDEKFSGIYVCQLFMSVLMLIVYMAYIIFSESKYKEISLIEGLFIFASMVNITWFLNGIEEFKLTAVRNAIVKVLSLLLIIIFVKGSDDLWKYTLIMAGMEVIGQISVWSLVRKRVAFKKTKWKDILPHVKPIVVLFVPILAMSVFVNMDKYMIGVLSDIKQNGFYENADKVINVPKAFVAAVGTVMLSRTAHLIANEREKESEEYVKWTMFYAIAFACALSFGIAAISDMFAVVFWGGDFAPCGELIKYMAPAIVLSVFGNVIRTQYLIPRERDREYTISLIVGAVVNFVVNLMLIPIWGAGGAVAATVLAELSMTGIQAYCVRKALPVLIYIKDGGVFMIFGLVMYIAVRVAAKRLESSIVALLGLVLLGAIIYLLLTMTWVMISKNPNAIILKKGLKKLICRNK